MATEKPGGRRQRPRGTPWRVLLLATLVCLPMSQGAAVVPAPVQPLQGDTQHSGLNEAGGEQAVMAPPADGGSAPLCGDEATCDAAAAASGGGGGQAAPGREGAGAGPASAASPHQLPGQPAPAADAAAASHGAATAGIAAPTAEPSASAATSEGQQPGDGAGDQAAVDTAAPSEQQAATDATAAATEQPVSEPQAAEDAAPATPAEEQPSALLDEQHHNFALSKDGAKVVAANREAKKAAALLDDDSDTFIKNDCRAEKWVMLELSQVAKVSRLELSQFELYSARVREWEAWGRQSHPRTDGFGSEYARTLNSSHWKLMGNFTAEKAKGCQAFAVDRPMWVRYLLLRFQTQHGPEPICAINGISVFGKSAAEELEDQLASASDEGLGLLQPEQLQELEAGGAASPPAPDADAPAAGDTGGGAAEADPAVAAEAGQPPPDDEPAAGAPAAQQQQQAAVKGAAAAAGDGGAPAQPEGAAAAVPAASQAATPGAADGLAAAHQSAAAPNAQVAGATGGDGNSSSPEAGGAATVGAATGSAAGSQQPLPPDSKPGAASATGGAAPAPVGDTGPTEQQAAGSSTGEASASAGAGNGSAPSQPQQASGPNSTTAADAAAPAGASAADEPAPAPAAGRASAPRAPAAAPSPPPTGKAATPPPQPAAAPVVATAPAPAAPPLPPTPPAPLAAGLQLPLAGLGGKAKGGSVYDILVQEIRAAKLQQKLLTKSVLELQRNASAQYAELAADVSSLAATLAKLPTDHNVSEEELATRVDTLVRAHLLHVSAQMLGLQAALASSAKQQHALLCFLAMLGGVLALNATGFSQQWPRAKYAVLLLAAANGLVGVALQLQGGMARQAFWPQALPWSQAANL